MVSTFPYFQLSYFASLVTDLGLSPTSYLDTYNIQTEQWEQHSLPPSDCNSQQRLLYRIRRSLLDGLLEDECIGISPTPELEPRTLKRPASSGSPGRRVSKIHISNGHYLANTNISEGASSAPATIIATSTPTAEPDPLTMPSQTLIAQSPSGSNTTQRTAFERVFGSRYVKSTVCRHRGVWKRAPRDLRQQFEALGSDERGCWGEFVRRVEGRIPNKVPIKQPMNTIYVGQASASSEPHPRLATTAEPVMDSLQNPAEFGEFMFEI
ncbi:hypothetical protein BD779DRAFT_1517409 [Infundibulicybe gibba]|nr:hypothetical protein BD779DRAFT_1517409 [Infundibulicybe gibba]